MFLPAVRILDPSEDAHGLTCVLCSQGLDGTFAHGFASIGPTSPRTTQLEYVGSEYALPAELRFVD